MLGFVSTHAVILLSLTVLCSARSALRGMFPDKYPPMLQNGVNPGNPLFLTPYVEKGQFDTGKGKFNVQFICGRKGGMNFLSTVGIELEPLIGWNKNPSLYWAIIVMDILVFSLHFNNSFSKHFFV